MTLRPPVLRIFFALLLVGLVVCSATTLYAATVQINVGPGGTLTFNPANVTINPGDIIRWQWVTGIHTTTSGAAGAPDGLWDAPIDASNTMFSRTFNSSGIFPYHCQFHGLTMNGTITVTGTSCTIGGPSPVCPNTAGFIYTATPNPSTGTITYSWSISGQGTIVGSTTSQTVNVTSLGVGSFTLVMNGIRGGNPFQCTRVVTVTAPTTCSITGPSPVNPGQTGIAYGSIVSPSGGTVTRSWSISGNGTITSGTTGTSVTVTAGATGSFTLTLNVARNGCPGSCQRVITVSGPTCTVDGPSNVISGATGIGYTSTVSPAGGTLTYAWSITGNGTITSATNTSSVTVTAGAVGSFTLTLDGTRDGTAFQCQKVVTVDPAPSCNIAGPDPVAASSTGNIYTGNVTPSGGTVTYAWSVAGNGSITSATNTASVTVTAGASGSFTLTLDGTRNGTAFQCQKDVTIQAGGAAAIITASDIGGFSPAHVVINQGESVEWVLGSGIHTTTNGVSSDPAHSPGSLWDEPIDGANPSFTYQFNTPGYYPFFCRPHELSGLNGSVQVLATTSGVGDGGNRFRLLPSPNPFRSKVVLNFTLDVETRVVLGIYDLNGRKVLGLLMADLPQGEHKVTWGGWDSRHQPVPPGVYFARLETGDGRMKVLKLFKAR